VGCGDGCVRSHVLAVPPVRHGALQRVPVNLGLGLALILTITFLSPVLFDILARS
jgi:type III secretory pathway component EscR